MESPYKYFGRVAEEAEAKGWGLDLAAVSVLAYLLASSRHGVATAGRKTIAAFFGLTERQVRNSTGQLIACGAIERITPRSCSVLLNVGPDKTPAANVAQSWPQMIFNNCNFVDCQIDRAATSLDSRKDVKGLTNVRIVGNQIITEDGEKAEKKERPENGQDGGENAENGDADAIKRISPHTPFKEKTEEYIYSTPQPPKGGVPQTLSASEAVPAGGVELRKEEGEAVADEARGGMPAASPKNETRGLKNGLDGQGGAVNGAGARTPRKTASKTFFSECPAMAALADPLPQGGDPVPNPARLAEMYPDWQAKGADLRHYWLAASHWSDKRDMRRTARGWRATLAEWMRRDEAAGRLVKTPRDASPAPADDLFAGMTEEELAEYAAATSDDGEEERRRQSVEAEYRRLYCRA